MRSLAFLVFQLALLATALGAAARRSGELEAMRRLPPLRNEPLRVTPLYDDPRVVTDNQLREVLSKLRPRLRGERPKINHIDHALRFWGLEANFRDPDCLSGVEMRDLLLDHRRFAAAWGEESLPLLVPQGDGLRVRTQEGLSTASHVDHTLGCLAEAGVPLDHVVITAAGPTTVRAMLEQSLRDFSLNQVEYEWSTLAYALYFGEAERWFSGEGQEISFDRLADRIMRQRYGEGVCMGNHRLHALVMLLRVEEQTPRLSPTMRGRVLEHLHEATRRLVAAQHSEGYWTGAWPKGQEAWPASDPSQDTLQNRILATGHALEWWALTPEEVHPPRETVIRAGQWLARAIGEMDDQHILTNYTFLTHAGRALTLWRGSFPAEWAPHLNASTH